MRVLRDHRRTSCGSVCHGLTCFFFSLTLYFSLYSLYSLPSLSFSLAFSLTLTAKRHSILAFIQQVAQILFIFLGVSVVTGRRRYLDDVGDVRVREERGDVAQTLAHVQNVPLDGVQVPEQGQRLLSENQVSLKGCVRIGKIRTGRV